METIESCIRKENKPSQPRQDATNLTAFTQKAHHRGATNGGKRSAPQVLRLLSFIFSHFPFLLPPFLLSLPPTYFLPISFLLRHFISTDPILHILYLKVSRVSLSRQKISGIISRSLKGSEISVDTMEMNQHFMTWGFNTPQRMSYSGATDQFA